MSPGQPPLPVGTWGEISYRERGTHWDARARFRDTDGITRIVSRAGSSRADARRKLLAALRDRARKGTTLTADDTVTKLWDAWRPTMATTYAPSTQAVYERAWRLYIQPRTAGLRVNELTTAALEHILADITHAHGASSAHHCRNLLSNLMKYAVKSGAATHNTVAGTTHFRPPRKPPRALTPAQIRELRAHIRAYEAQGRTKADLLDPVDLMLTTGMRVGEVLALRWEDVDPGARTLTVAGTITMTAAPPRQLVRQDHPKTASSWRRLILPDHAVALLARRLAAAPRDVELVFPSATGGPRDPSGLRRSLRRALAGTAFEWVTPHTFRRTVATAIQDLPTAADVLGHSTVQVTRQHYVDRAKLTADVCHVYATLISGE